jgi:hypothetical protein
LVVSAFPDLDGDSDAIHRAYDSDLRVGWAGVVTV